MKVEYLEENDVKEYTKLLNTLQKEGFSKIVDNGEHGLNGNLLTTTFTKESMVITVIHAVKLNRTYVVTEENVSLSKHLFYQNEYIEDNVQGAQTTLHMLELYRPGNSFVIQMKNGHFIICDGGYKEELSYLIEYLEKLVPKGQKPIIEAWMISHPHVDHVGLFGTFGEDKSYADRIYVEGIYGDLYSDELAEELKVIVHHEDIRNAAKMLKTTTGNSPEIYRPHAGQRYYFNDITIDVMQTMVQVKKENWYKWPGNLNEWSTWLMFTIDGQKMLNAGDADFGAMKVVMDTFDREYLDMEIMAVQHHGVNVHNEFTDFINVRTLLYPYFGEYGVFEEGQTWPGSWQASVYRNQYLHKTVEETMSYGDGTKVLTFPYKTGTAISLKSRGERVEFTGINKERRIDYSAGGVL